MGTSHGNPWWSPRRYPGHCPPHHTLFLELAPESLRDSGSNSSSGDCRCPPLPRRLWRFSGHFSAAWGPQGCSRQAQAPLSSAPLQGSVRAVGPLGASCLDPPGGGVDGDGCPDGGVTGRGGGRLGAWATSAGWREEGQVFGAGRGQEAGSRRWHSGHSALPRGTGRGGEGGSPSPSAALRPRVQPAHH